MHKSNLSKTTIVSDPITKWDWLLFSVLTIFCYFSFIHGDIYVTGNRAFYLFESGFSNYYDALHAWTGDYGANYMPSTFWLLAFWNLPLKLLGFDIPAVVSASQTRLLYGLWYKLFTTILYFCSAYLIYRIAKQIGLNKHRAKLTMFSFMTMPIGYFSQFIFSQQDIFTVVFMLLGIYCFFNNRQDTMKNIDHWLFCLFFGITVTFKYQALLFFVVLLFIRTKNVKKIIFSMILAALPFVLEYVLYMDSDGFQKGVFGFFALDYVNGSDFSTSLGTVGYLKAACVFIVIWSYFLTPKNHDDEVRWVLYLCCGLCFALFGLGTWHPQWLLLAVPFWVLSASINVHREKFYWGNIIFVVVFYMFIVQHWAHNVDNALLKLGIWKYVLADHPFIGDIVDFIPLIDPDTLYSVIFSIVLSMFVFTHPKYTLEHFSDDDGKDCMGLIRLQLIAAVFGFALPCFYTLYRAVIA